MTTKNLNVCLLPMEISWGEKEQNLMKVARLFEGIHPDTDLVVLPETFSTGFSSGVTKDEIRPLAERNTGPTIDFLKKLAAKHCMAVAGSFIADTGGSLYNRAFFIEPSGEESFADKRHLFTMAGEHENFSRGHGRMKVRYRGWEISMVICYDIRFPIWCRNVNNEYDLLIAVANWPKVRVDAWNQLLKGRAIENECYIVGVNCRGTDPGDFEYDGSSMAVDFKGKVISQEMGEDYIYAVLNKDKLERFREKFPAYRDADEFRIID